MVELQFSQLSTAGDRRINQDCMAARLCPDYALFMVADGLGGHHAGEKTSRFFCRGVFSLLEKYQPMINSHSERTFTKWIEEAIAVMRRQFADDPRADKAHTT